MRAVIVLTLLSAALVAVAGCGGSEETGSGQTVVAAFYPVAYAAEQIAPGADVQNLTPAGAEPHDLELSPRDVERVQDADLVLYLGEGFMPALEDAVSRRVPLSRECLRPRTDSSDGPLPRGRAEREGDRGARGGGRGGGRYDGLLR